MKPSLQKYFDQFVHDAPSSQTRLADPNDSIRGQQPRSHCLRTIADENRQLGSSGAPIIPLSFEKAHRECAEQLDNFKASLSREYAEVEEFLESRTQWIVERLLQQNQQLKDTLLEMVTGVFEKNSSRISQALLPQMHQEGLQADSIHNRVYHLSREIDHLRESLQGRHYRDAMAYIITSDLSSQIGHIKSQAEFVKGQLSQREFNLVLNPSCLENVRRELASIYCIEEKIRSEPEAAARQGLQEATQLPRSLVKGSSLQRTSIDHRLAHSPIGSFAPPTRQGPQYRSQSSGSV